MDTLAEASKPDSWAASKVSEAAPEDLRPKAKLKNPESEVTGQ